MMKKQNFTKSFKNVFSVLVMILVLFEALSVKASFDNVEEDLGFDMEIDTRSLIWLIPYFDRFYLASWIEKKGVREALLTEEIMEDYLVDKKNLEMLPRDLYEELTKGLDLSSPIRWHTSNKVDFTRRDEGLHVHKSPALVARDGSPLEPQAKIILPTLDRSPPKKPLEILRDSVTAESSQVQSDWEILHARWRLLPAERKRSAVLIERLSLKKTADLILKLPVQTKSSKELMEALILVPGAPSWLKKLEWSLDGMVSSENFLSNGRTFELAFKGKDSNHERMFELVTTLLKELKLNRQNAFSQKFLDRAFHWHFSYPGLDHWTMDASQQRLYKRIFFYRVLLLTQVLAGGSQNDLVLADAEALIEKHGFLPAIYQNIYDRALTITSMPSLQMRFDKGMIAKISNSHYELREVADPVIQMKELIELLSIVSDKTYEKEISKRVQRLVSGDISIFSRIAKNNSKILKDYGRLLPSELFISLLKKSFYAEPMEGGARAQILRILGQFSFLPEAIEALITFAEEGYAKIDWNLVFKADDVPALQERLKDLYFKKPGLFLQLKAAFLTTEDLDSHLHEIPESSLMEVIDHLLQEMADSQFEMDRKWRRVRRSFQILRSRIDENKLKKDELTRIHLLDVAFSQDLESELCNPCEDSRLLSFIREFALKRAYDWHLKGSSGFKSILNSFDFNKLSRVKNEALEWVFTLVPITEAEMFEGVKQHAREGELGEKTALWILPMMAATDPSLKEKYRELNQTLMPNLSLKEIPKPRRSLKRPRPL